MLIICNFLFFRICFGYLYPAYMCLSALNSGELKWEQLRTWCWYWYEISLFVLYHVMERICHVYIMGMRCLPHSFSSKLNIIEHRYLHYFLNRIIYVCQVRHAFWWLDVCMFLCLLNLHLFCVIRSVLFWLVFVFDFVRVSLSLNISRGETLCGALC